jgi:hypothetical protein
MEQKARIQISSRVFLQSMDILFALMMGAGILPLWLAVGIITIGFLGLGAAIHLGPF